MRTGGLDVIYPQHIRQTEEAGVAKEIASKAQERVALLPPAEAKRIAQGIGMPENMSAFSVFRVLLRHPSLCKALHGLLQELLQRGKLDVRLRELMILRIGWASKSEYEWVQHWRVAKQCGLDEADMLAVREWRNSDRFGAAERAVLAATDETIETGTISPETWRACEAALGSPEVLIELVVVIGHWRLFSSLLRSLEIPLEEGAISWPPDGRRP